MAKKKPKTKKTSPSSSGLRPPIVTIMGHVDHGKTTLLDNIRKSHLTDKEAGGITQHIGAYQIEHKGNKTTFIDTPGHAAFAKMRARGAQVTDIVVLVVAANDGPKPQTVESINHIRAADVPFIVAINKIDLPEADVTTTKSELAKYEVVVEDFGGKIPTVEISAKTGKNIDQLLELIQLVSELENLTGDPEGELEAIIIESHLDKNRGPVATVIIKNGTLKKGQAIFVDESPAKVRSLTNDQGNVVLKASLSSPVAISGFKSTPPVGATISTKPHQPTRPKPKKKIKEIKMEDEEIDIDAMLEGKEPEKRPSIEIVLKADVEGTLEAIKSNLSGEVILVGSGIGPITESDVLLAVTTGARIFAFNVTTPPDVTKLAVSEQVTIKNYTVIYELLEDVEKQILKLLEPTIDEEELGVTEITTIFAIRKDKIAGCKIKSGEIKKTHTLHLVRDDKILKDIKIKSLKRGKEDIDKAKAGSECGIILTSKTNFKEGDKLVAFKKISD